MTPIITYPSAEPAQPHSTTPLAQAAPFSRQILIFLSNMKSPISNDAGQRLTFTNRLPQTLLAAVQREMNTCKYRRHQKILSAAQVATKSFSLRCSSRV